MNTPDKYPKFQAGGKPIVCSHCGCDRLSEFISNGLFLGFMFGLQCSACLHIELFVGKPKEVKNDS